MVRPELQQLLQYGHISFGCREHQRRISVFIGGIDIHPPWRMEDADNFFEIVLEHRVAQTVGTSQGRDEIGGGYIRG